jgi:hypothetical protein
MDIRWLDHQLTVEERFLFKRDGYITVENALEPALLETAVAAVDRIDGRVRADRDYTSEQRINLHDCIGRDHALLELIDLPKVFPKVWGLMGWNIYLFHTQMVVSLASSEPVPVKNRLGWHQDQNRTNGDLDMEGLPVNPMISLKVGFFLTDTTDVGVGNLYIAPRQQERKRIEYSEDGPDMPVNGIPVRVKAGSAVIFDRRLWHASSPNYLNRPRKVLFYGYAYRWVRPKCIMAVDELLATADPIRRQLLGGSTSQSGYYLPQDEDIPLRAWLRENSEETFAWKSR